MSYPTKQGAERVALACRDYLAAHERRSDTAEWMTLNERGYLAVLLHEIAAVTGEAVTPLSGTAA